MPMWAWTTTAWVLVGIAVYCVVAELFHKFGRK